eukprot:IDg3393t1
MAFAAEHQEYSTAQAITKVTEAYISERYTCENSMESPLIPAARTLAQVDCNNSKHTAITYPYLAITQRHGQNARPIDNLENSLSCT